MIVIDITPVTFEFPAPTRLMNMNDRAHWTKQRAQARAWRRTARMYARAELGIVRQLGPSTVTIDLPVPGNRRRDPHNYFPTVKHIIDGLVDAGLWPDDTPEWVTTTEPTLAPHPVKATWRPVRVTITPRSSQ